MAEVTTVTRLSFCNKALIKLVESGVDCRIIHIAAAAAAVEGLAVRRIEGPAAAKALGQIRVGEEQRREGDEIGRAVADRGIGAGEVIALVAHQRAAPNLAEEADVRHLAGRNRI